MCKHPMQQLLTSSCQGFSFEDCRDKYSATFWNMKQPFTRLHLRVLLVFHKIHLLHSWYQGLAHEIMTTDEVMILQTIGARSSTFRTFNVVKDFSINQSVSCCTEWVMLVFTVPVSLQKLHRTLVFSQSIDQSMYGKMPSKDPPWYF